MTGHEYPFSPDHPGLTGPATPPPTGSGGPGVAQSRILYGSGRSVNGTPGAYLATLPDPIAEHLVEMVKVAADTSPSEKCFIVTWLESLATNIMANISCREDSTAIQLVAALGQMIAAVGEPQEGTHDVSTPDTEEVA